MGNAPDIPPEELNLTHMRTITAPVGSMQRVQHEVDEIGRQFAASLFRLRSSFDLIDQLFHTAGGRCAFARQPSEELAFFSQPDVIHHVGQRA